MSPAEAKEENNGIENAEKGDALRPVVANEIPPEKICGAAA